MSATPDGGTDDAAAGPLLGAAVAVGLTALLRGLPSPSERPAAEGGALPL